MTWISIDLNEQTDVLHSRFDVVLPEGEGWSRALGERYLPAAIEPRAWVHIETGNLVLVESIAAPARHKGKVLARLWVAATGMTVGLPANGDDFGMRTVHGSQEEAMSFAVDAARELLGLP